MSCYVYMEIKQYKGNKFLPSYILVASLGYHCPFNRHGLSASGQRMWVGMGVSTSISGTNKDRLTDGAKPQFPSQLEGRYTFSAVSALDTSRGTILTDL